MPCSICKQIGHNIKTCPQNLIKVTTTQNQNTVQSNQQKCHSCVICLEEIKDQPRTELECSHVFCTKCITKNMSMGDTKCPICRTFIIDPNAEIADLKQQIITLEQLNIETQRALGSLTTELSKVKIFSLEDLRGFVRCCYTVPHFSTPRIVHNSTLHTVMDRYNNIDRNVNEHTRTITPVHSLRPATPPLLPPSPPSPPSTSPPSPPPIHRTLFRRQPIIPDNDVIEELN
jgi:NAD-dependent dihydropyrimidine dehydrogenase PreA subunit